MTTVLYVENEENDVLFMRRAFKQAGLIESLRAVPSSREAMDYLSGRAPFQNRGLHPFPALLLMDLSLPSISGFDLLRWVRAQPQLQELIVVVFSSSARPEDLKRARELGANDYFQKPTSGSQFVEVVRGLQQKWLA